MQVTSDHRDWVEIASPDRLFYLGPLTSSLQGWFDRWGSPFYAFAQCRGIALELLHRVTVQEWQTSQARVA